MLKRRWLTYRTTAQGDVPYFKRRVPKALCGHPQLPREFIRQKLNSDPGDEVALLTEFTELSSTVDAWLDSLASANHGVLHQQEVIRRATAWLKRNSLAPGDLQVDPKLTDTQNERKQDAVDRVLEGTGLLDSLRNWHLRGARSPDNIGEKLPDMPADVQVNEMVWELLNKPELAAERHTLGRVWSEYSAKKSSDWDKREKAREEKRWNRFQSYAGGSSVELARSPLNKALNLYVDDRELSGVSPSTIKRELAGVCAALRAYIDRHDLDITIRKPKLKEGRSEERFVLDVVPHADLHKAVLGLPDDWKKLALLIMVQTSLHSKELMSLKREDLVTKDLAEGGTVTYLRIADGKTAARKRVVPLVASIDEVERLTELLSDSDWLLPGVRETSESNWSAQLNKVLKRLTGERTMTSYSLRHTWKSRANGADLNQHWMDRLGGWSRGNLGATYGLSGEEHDESLLAAKAAQEKVNKHLLAG